MNDSDHNQRRHSKKSDDNESLTTTPAPRKNSSFLYRCLFIEEIVGAAG